MDTAALRELFPITGTKKAFFGHCTASPLARPVIDAIHEVVEQVALNGGIESQDRMARRKRWRANLAALIGAQPEEIAYANNTVDAIHFVTSGLTWKPGDVVVTADIEFPANVYQWLNLRSRGVTTKLVRARDGRLQTDDVIAALDSSTRLVALSLAQFIDGQRLDVERIGSACRERGILFLLDAIQGIGSIEFDVRRCAVDFACAGGHKWLLGPMGSGFFYCRRELLDTLHVPTLGHASMLPQDDMLAYRFEPRPEASRFEGGAPNVLPQYGFDAAIAMITKIGLAPIIQRIHELGDILHRELPKRGYTVRSPSAPQDRSGIVAFTSDVHDAAHITGKLRERDVIVSPACGVVRAAPHFYNTEAEVERLLSALP